MAERGMSGKMTVTPRPKKGTTGNIAGRMTAQQELFVDELCKNNFNQKAAAIAAGVKESNAGRQANLWLDSNKFPHISLAVQRKLEERRNTSEVDAKRIIQELARIGFFNPKRLLRPDGKGMIELKDMPDDIAAVIQNINVAYGEEVDGDGNFTRVKYMRFTFHDKLSALGKLAGMLGLDNGGATTIINNTQNNYVINFDDMYRQQGIIQARDENDVIEARIRAEEALALPPAQVTASHEDGSALSPEEMKAVQDREEAAQQLGAQIMTKIETAKAPAPITQ